MQGSPITTDIVNRAIDRAISCLHLIPIDSFRKAIKDLELARLLINKAARTYPQTTDSGCELLSDVPENRPSA